VISNNCKLGHLLTKVYRIFRNWIKLFSLTISSISRAWLLINYGHGKLVTREGRGIMPERRIKASHPDYETLNGLSSMIAMAKNPRFHRIEIDLPEIEINALIQTLEDELCKELEGGAFADYINAKILL
jgi:hypothetical protein